MPTECSAGPFGFGTVEGRSVVAAFDGGAVSSDAGALLLGATDRAIRLVERFAACFADGRDARRIEHAVTTMIGQRVIGIALGYEDLVDHDRLRHDPVMAILADKLEAHRTACAPLAGKSTLNRLEHGAADTDRYRKIGHDGAAIERLLVDLFLDAHRTPPKQIILDLDATDDPLHGHQEGRFFHGYGAGRPCGPTDCYCYLPLYVFSGRHLLATKLRRSNIDASAGAVEEVDRIVGQIRKRWPRVRILLRADSGFAREALMTLAGLLARVAPRNGSMACWPSMVRGEPGRLCLRPRPQRPAGRRHRHRARSGRGEQSSDRHAGSRVQGAALGDPRQLEPPTSGDRQGGVDPWRAEPTLHRHVAQAAEIDGRRLYEAVYCARGEMENRIKECQLDLFADRTSAATMKANQLRLWLASMAYVLLCAAAPHRPRPHPVRRRHLRHYSAPAAQDRRHVRVSCRRIKVAMASAFPWQPGVRAGPTPAHPPRLLNQPS